MPFRSRAQERWMYANKPELAAEFEAHTPKGAHLPEHVKPKAKPFPKRKHRKKAKRG